MMVGLLFGPAIAGADVVFDWNEIAVNTAIASGQNPFAQARFAAIAQLAVFEAVNAVNGIPSAGEFLLDPPPALTSNGYAKDYVEVMTVGSLASTERPPDRADVVRFFQVSSPTLVCNLAARQIADAQGRSMSDDVDDARVYGGIHFRFEQVGGGRRGREIATSVYKNNLRPVPDPR